jgi:hypothetical protein
VSLGTTQSPIQQISKSAPWRKSVCRDYTDKQSWNPMEIQKIFKSAGGSLSLGTTRLISPETQWKFNRFLRVLEEVCL